MSQLDLSRYRNTLSWGNRLGRVAWRVVWAVLFRPSPVYLHSWRRLLARLFGAKVEQGAKLYPSVDIWAPWNLKMGEYSCLGPHVICYSVAQVSVGPHAIVSQYSHLCTASHDIEDAHMRLTTAPICIERGAWVTTDVFVGPGITIGEGAVVAARSTVTKNVDPWTVVGGNPAKFIKHRQLLAE